MILIRLSHEYKKTLFVILDNIIRKITKRVLIMAEWTTAIQHQLIPCMTRVSGNCIFNSHIIVTFKYFLLTLRKLYFCTNQYLMKYLQECGGNDYKFFNFF